MLYTESRVRHLSNWVLGVCVVCVCGVCACVHMGVCVLCVSVFVCVCVKKWRLPADQLQEVTTSACADVLDEAQRTNEYYSQYRDSTGRSA